MKIAQKTTDSRTIVRPGKNENNIESTTNNHISLHTLVPGFTFLNHKGASVKGVVNQLF